MYSAKPHCKRYCDSATIFETNKTEIEKCSLPDVLNHRLGFVNNEFDQLFCCVAVSNCQKRLLSVSKRTLFISDTNSLQYVQTDLFIVYLPEPFLVSSINLGKKVSLSLSWFIIFRSLLYVTNVTRLVLLFMIRLGPIPIYVHNIVVAHTIYIPTFFNKTWFSRRSFIFF